MDNPLIIGSAIVDIVIELDSLPKSGQDILAMSEKISVGGCALNVVCVLKAHDVRHTAFLPIGQGKNANIIQTELKKIKINSLLDVYAGDNGHCYTFIESHGERSFVTLQGIESQFKKEWFSKITEKHSHIYISGYSLLGKGSECIVEYCELNPTSKVIFAPGPVIDVIDLTIFNRILKLAPILHINEDELKKYCRSTELKDQ